MGKFTSEQKLLNLIMEGYWWKCISKKMTDLLTEILMIYWKNLSKVAKLHMIRLI